MKLSRVRLLNFRCYRDEFSLDLDDLTILIGKNDIGKSAILDALGIFFGDVKIDSDDGCVRGDKKNVRIICEFEDLPNELIIDADFPTKLADEHLLNEQGKLEIHQVFNTDLKTAKQSGMFAYAYHPTIPGRDDLLLLKNAELKTRATELNVNMDGVNLRVNTHIRRRLWESGGNLEFRQKEIPLDIETAKKIWEQLRQCLPSFALFKSDRSSTDQDSEAQDPMKAAIKEALKSKEADLNAISKYVEREVRTIAEQTLDKLREMDQALASELNPVFTPPNWSSVFKINLTSEEAIPLNKRGSGVRRLVLLNFFRARAEQNAISSELPSVIYAIEEPETSQHPNNQVMLINAFQELAEYPERQVIVTTHTPTLARLVPIKCLRYICCDDNGCRVVHSGSDETYKQIVNSLGVLPDHGVKLFIGLEGRNDIIFLKNISRMLHDNGEDVVDLYDSEEKGKVIFFPLGGSNLALWTTKLANLNRPEFYLFDRDEKPPTVSKYQKKVDEINQRENCYAALTNKKETENYIHPSAIHLARPEVKIYFGDFDDVPALVAQTVHANSESPNEWGDLPEDTIEKKISKAKNWLNSEASRLMTPDLLTEIDPNGEVRSWLKTIKELIDAT